MNATPSTLKGIGLMLCAMAILPYLDVTAKFLGRQGIPVIEIVWARMVFGALFTLPFALKVGGGKALLPSPPLIHTTRAILLLLATYFFFSGLRHLSVADTLAIFFIQPLIVTVLSPLVLGENVSLQRWLAVATGFCGTLIIIRPGFQELNIGVLYALGAGLMLALYLLLTRRITGQQHAVLTTFHTNTIGGLILSVMMVFTWVRPEPYQWGLFLLVGFIAVFGHYLIVRAYDYAEASLLAPLAYMEMVMATVGGWYFFGDFPDKWTFIGVGILIGCAIFISWREHNRNGAISPEFEQP